MGIRAGAGRARAGGVFHEALKRTDTEQASAACPAPASYSGNVKASPGRPSSRSPAPMPPAFPSSRTVYEAGGS